jgi:hypothetical protein
MFEHKAFFATLTISDFFAELYIYSSANPMTHTILLLKILYLVQKGSKWKFLAGGLKPVLGCRIKNPRRLNLDGAGREHGE